VNAGAVAKLLQRLLHGVIDEMSVRAVAQQRHAIFRAAAIGRNRKAGAVRARRTAQACSSMRRAARR